ncbi:MAG: radical SAM protein [Actinobacteria bacterium]|nr:radical SAM protein [Actinomycetota bacterium]
MKKLGYSQSGLWDKEISHLSAPSEIHFSITNKCPLRCPNCYVDGGCEVNDELSLNDIKRSIDIFSELGVFQIAFGGGEPFAHPDLIEIVKYAREKGIVPNITTNGYYIEEELAKECRIFGQINISLDGVSGEALKLRGEESFLVADKAIKLLVKSGARVGINVVLSSVNFDHLEQSSEYARSNKIKDILLLRYKPLGRGQKNYNQLALKTDHLKRLFPLTQKISYKLGVRFRADCSLFPSLVYHAPDPTSLEYWGMAGCDAGNNLVSITPQGRFKTCSFCYDDGGIVFDLKEQWQENSHLNLFRKWNELASEPCKICKYLSLCKGGCHPIAYMETGSFNNPDPSCPIAEDYFNGKFHKALRIKEET